MAETTAWQPQLYDFDPETAKNVPNPAGSVDSSPVAMESEVFDKDGSARVQQRQGPINEPKGCWYRFKRGVRSIWQTKHTEDTKHDRELFVKTTLRELVIYLIFLTVLCIITFGMTSDTMFYFTKVMTELFLITSVPNLTKGFRGISQMDDFWTFVEGPFMDGLYWERWYNNEAVADNETGFIFFENKLLGLPRLRQLRVVGGADDGGCDVPDAFEREITRCYEAYSGGAEDRSPFGARNGTAWRYQSADELSTQSHWGLVATYGGGGFVSDLPLNRAAARAQVGALKADRWIDRATRAVLVDFAVYNANVNLFCIVKFVLEFPPTGGIVPSWSFHSLKLIRYVSFFDKMILACEGVFVFFIIYYIIEEIIEIKRWRLSYFKSFWNLLDIVVILISVCCIGFSIYRYVSVDKKLDELLGRHTLQYANFEFLGFAQTRFNDAIAILVFFAWIKIFKYISFNKTMNQLSSTLSRCAKDVGGFAVMFFIFFFAYAQLGYLIFGTQVKDFSTFYDAVFTLLRTILGDFNFHELEKANRVLGPIFFISYVFFVFFVLLNMFLAIINDTYAEVKAELATQKNEFELGDFFRRGYYNMLRKLNLKKDRLVDIQAALYTEGAGKQVDYDEWRDQLKRRGYAEQEIESMFAKYDLDGDRVLDENEQRRLQDDLQGERVRGGASDGAGERQPIQLHLGEIEDRLNAQVPPSARGDGGAAPLALVMGAAAAADDVHTLNRRIDRIENAVGSVVSKIDGAMQRLESLEKMRLLERNQVEQTANALKNADMSDPKVNKEVTEKLTKEAERDNQT